MTLSSDMTNDRAGSHPKRIEERDKGAYIHNVWGWSKFSHYFCCCWWILWPVVPGVPGYRSMLTAPIIIIPFFTNYYLPTVHQTQTPLCGWNHRMSARFITTTTGIYGNMGIGNGRIDSHILQQAVSSMHFIKIVNLPPRYRADMFSYGAKTVPWIHPRYRSCCRWGIIVMHETMTIWTMTHSIKVVELQPVPVDLGQHLLAHHSTFQLVAHFLHFHLFHNKINLFIFSWFRCISPQRETT